MKLGLNLFFALLFCGWVTIPAKAAFIEGLEDLPLATGLTQITQDNISFGNEESRLVEASFKAHKTSFAKIEKFYIETLPQLGWIFQGKRNKNTLSFVREGETLDIVQEQKSPLIIRITVKNKLQ